MVKGFKVLGCFLVTAAFLFCFVSSSFGEEKGIVFSNEVVSIRFQWQHDPVSPNSVSALAAHFELAEDWHFYADADTAPGGQDLKIVPKSGDNFKFREAIYPASESYYDKGLQKQLQVYSNEFTVYLPFEVNVESWPIIGGEFKAFLNFEIKGAVCSGFQCRIVGESVRFSAPSVAEQESEPIFALPDPNAKAKESSSAGSEIVEAGRESALVVTVTKLGLAFIVGLLFNVMPCVLPVIPLIVSRLLKQAQQQRGKSIALGFTFCFGILVFFIALAVLNIVLRLGFNTVLQWGEYFRYPWFVQGMALLMILLGLFMFGLFSIAIPSSVTSKTGSGEGFLGSVGMGFLAALLSTPCSFGILAGVFAWAQTQTLAISSLTMLVMGAGMAAPYAVLVSFPSLLNKLPKPGGWMEIVKVAMGFVLLGIGVKLIEALPEKRVIDTLYFALVLGFGAWMWGGWVGYQTPKMRKYVIRIIAVVLVVLGGFYLLPVREGLIDWQEYDSVAIENAIDNDRPVLIKFDADWCTNCKLVERRVYQKKTVADLLEEKNFLVIKGDTTTKDMPATDALNNVYNEPGIPVTVLHLPGRERPVKLRGIISAEQLIEAVEGVSR